MGLARVKEEIIRKANSEASKIINEGKVEAERFISEAKKEIEEKEKEAKTEKQLFLETMEKKELAAVDFKIRKDSFQKKKELMKEVFEKAQEKLLKSNPQKKKLFLEKLFSKTKKEINVKRVYSAKGNKQFFPEVEYKESDINGGMIAETQDGSVRVDYSFDTLLNDIEEKNLHKIAKILFGK